MSSDVAELDRVSGLELTRWTVATLGDMFAVSTPGHWGDEPDGDGNILVLRSTNFRKAGGLVYETAAKRQFDDRKLVQKRLQRGDIILERSGGSPAQPVGRARRFDAEGCYSASNFMQIMRAADQVDDWFACYLLDYIYGQGLTEPLQKATTGIRNLDFKAFLDLPVSVPPLDEQRRIAAVLRSVDEAIASNQQCLTQAGSVRAALLQRHFHMAEWADDQTLPDGWEMPLLDTVATRGSGHTPNKKIDSYWNGGIKWVSLQDTKKLDQVYISTTAQQISDDGIRNSSAVLHPDGVVVISRDATVGRSAITLGPMAVSQHFIAYCCGKTLNNHYLYYWLQRMKPVFERIGAGSTIKTIGLPFFKSLRIALPPLDEQLHIADVMLDADKAMMSAAAAIKSIRKVKAVVMSDLLSGHVRVPA